MSLIRSRLMGAAALVLTFLLAPDVGAQDRFGAALTFTDGGEVAVLKPGAAVGPAMAIVFGPGPDGRWDSTSRLTKLPGGYPGEGVVEVLSAGGDLLLLGSGDPAGREAGHLYTRASGSWTATSRVPLDPSLPGEGAELPAGGLDMPTLSRIMGPPPRSVALTPDGQRMVVAGGALDPGVVHVLDRSDTGWTLTGALNVEHTSTTFTPALAAHDGSVAVGVPQSGPGGMIFVFEEERGWDAPTIIAPDSTQAGGLLGAALVFGGSGYELFASSPGAGRVTRYERGSDGAWRGDEDFLPPSEHASDARGFGAAIAADGDHLVVGSPFAREAQGAAYVFARGANGWTLARSLGPEDLGRATFGLAVALNEGTAVIGAPGAYGADGRAAVYDLASEGAPIWLEAGGELSSVAGAEPIRCADGDAAGFECDAVDLVSFVSLDALGAQPGERVTDIWGWTDPTTGREYVLVGRTAGMAFVDITDASVPRLVGLMPANPSGARDIKVYRDHAYMTGDGAGDHGLLVFDLSRLRGVIGAPRTFEPDARYDLVASAHNLIIDTESGFAYTVGTNTGGQSCGGGLHMIDIREPLEPTFAGCFTDTEGLIWSGRTHDAQCTVYRGPDENFQGRQICFASNETAMRIVDVTDKSAPVPISTASHPGTAYIHQGWLTEDHRYLYVNDELDEIVGTADRTRTLIYDVAELDDPILVGEHLGPDQATDHNLFIAGNRAYLANYQAGFRVLDISDPESPVEVGWFDTTPYGENPPGFGGGAWTAWPFFQSGMVVVSSMNEGLFIVRPQRPVM
ncbi:MAG: choice-of-anchor B family protein [Gemmatimonadota bacterium]